MGGVPLASGRSCDSFASFKVHFCEVFGISINDTSAGEQLYRITQGRSSVNCLSTRSRTILRLQLTSQDDTIGLERFIQLSIRVSGRMQSCMERRRGQQSLYLRQPELHNPSEPLDEPMQIDSTVSPNRNVNAGCPRVYVFTADPRDTLG